MALRAGLGRVGRENRPQLHPGQHRLHLGPVDLSGQPVHNRVQRAILPAELGTLLPRAVQLLGHIGELEVDREGPGKLDGRANVQSGQ